MQPLQYDLRCSAAKDNSITHAAAAPSNLDAATTMRSAATELQNTIELHATASETATPQPDLAAKAEKNDFEALFKNIFKRKIATLMQPSQCVLQHDVANPHASTHTATPDDNNHAAIPMRSATTDSRNA